MKNYDRFSDNELKSKVALHLEFARSFDEEGAESREQAAEYQAELNRRGVEAFWLAHPGLRLRVGDELQITPELITLKRDQHNWDAGALRMLWPGHNTTIADISVHDNDNPVRILFLNSSTTAIPLSLAREMRQAYLDREAANEGTHETGSG